MFATISQLGVMGYRPSANPSIIAELAERIDEWIPVLQHVVARWTMITDSIKEDLRNREGENTEKMIQYMDKTSRRFRKADEAVKKYASSLQESAKISVERLHALSSDRAHNDKDLDGKEWDVITPVESKRANLKTYSTKAAAKIEKAQQQLEKLQNSIQDILDLPNCVRNDLEEWNIKIDQPTWSQWLYNFSHTPKIRKQMYLAGANAGVYIATSGVSVTDVYPWYTILQHPLQVLTEYYSVYLGGFGLGLVIMFSVCGVLDSYMRCRDQLEEIFKDLETVRDCIRRDMSLVGDWVVDTLRIKGRCDELELFECDRVIEELLLMTDTLKVLEKSAFVALLPFEKEAEWSPIDDFV